MLCFLFTLLLNKIKIFIKMFNFLSFLLNLHLVYYYIYYPNRKRYNNDSFEYNNIFKGKQK